MLSFNKIMDFCIDIPIIIGIGGQSDKAIHVRIGKIGEQIK